MFKVNNKNTRMTSRTYFRNGFGISIVDYEQANTGWGIDS